jgi:hypothetical protein
MIYLVLSNSYRYEGLSFGIESVNGNPSGRFVQQKKLISPSKSNWEEINGNSICLAKIVIVEAVNRKRD